MTEKRFRLEVEDDMYYTIFDDQSTDEEDKLYGLDDEQTCELLNELAEENKELIQHIKKLKKQLYLVHMSSMFSTVRSFKGDVSKRYYYSEKTDRVYDTANNYGQYDKILEKKEIAMLLNEYETLLNCGDLSDRE